jgi:hypothetical protein
MWGFTVSPNRELFFKNKDDITEFIVKSLDTETQNLYWMKFPKKITSQDVKQKQDKRNLNTRVYRLYLKLSNKLYGNDLSSVAFPNDEGEEEAAPTSPPKCNISLEIVDTDEEEAAPPKKQKTSIAPACPPKSELYIVSFACLHFTRKLSNLILVKLASLRSAWIAFYESLKDDRKTYICDHCRCQEIILIDIFAEKLKFQ